MKLSNRNKYLIFFLIISITTIGIILFFTANEKTLEALTKLKLEDLFFLLLIWMVSLFFDGLSIYFLVKASDENITVYTSIQTSAIKYFFNMITPFSFGGQPVMIYYLSQLNIPAGKSSSIVMTKLLLMSVWAFLGAAIAFYFNSELITSNLTVLIVFIVTGILQTLFVLSIIFIMLFPHLFFKFFLFIGKIGQKFKIFKK
ncbi:MAG: flippase-like domain-containing protein, partial [Spirochaetaceae bacterium]|nr:flippase-like domain-containing protein [Spirochaetaceae bacterium]